jgi:hypothetical protein
MHRSVTEYLPRGEFKYLYNPVLDRTSVTSLTAPDPIARWMDKLLSDRMFVAHVRLLDRR